MAALTEIHKYFNNLRRSQPETFKNSYESFTNILTEIMFGTRTSTIDLIRETRHKVRSTDKTYAHLLSGLESELVKDKKTLAALCHEIKQNKIVAFKNDEDEIELQDFETASSGKVKLQQYEYGQLIFSYNEIIRRLKKYVASRETMLEKVSASSPDTKEKNIIDTAHRFLQTKFFSAINIDPDAKIDRRLTIKKIQLAGHLKNELQELLSEINRSKVKSPDIDIDGYYQSIYYFLLLTENRHNSIVAQSKTGGPGEFSRIINTAKSEIEKISPQGKKVGEALFKEFISEEPKHRLGPKH